MHCARCRVFLLIGLFDVRKYMTVRFSIWNPTTGAPLLIPVYTRSLQVRKPDCQNLFSPPPHPIPKRWACTHNSVVASWIPYHIGFRRFSCREETCKHKKQHKTHCGPRCKGVFRNAARHTEEREEEHLGPAERRFRQHVQNSRSSNMVESSGLESAIGTLVNEFHKAGSGASLKTEEFKGLVSSQLPTLAKTMGSDQAWTDILQKMGVSGDGEGVSFASFWGLIQSLASKQFGMLSLDKASKCTCIVL